MAQRRIKKSTIKKETSLYGDKRLEKRGFSWKSK
jgi:hypothetical protein